ncbi:hypothetical protein DFQ29_008850 [Apophysomyces sp. BC1021]|nr:hypothetical protein DFQ29_008850 [Apophysomyces sp. BC1021]
MPLKTIAVNGSSNIQHSLATLGPVNGHRQFSQQPHPVAMDEDQDAMEENSFYQLLHKHSALYRIVLAKPYHSEIILGQWYRLDLEVVNELGLPLKGGKACQCVIRLACEVLQDSRSGIIQDTAYRIETRPLQLDEWEAEDGDTAVEWPGFHHSGLGGLEYRLSKIDNGSQHDKTQYLTKAKYLCVLSTFDSTQTFHTFPLIVGPLKVSDKEEQVSMNGVAWDADLKSAIMHRGFSLDHYNPLMTKRGRFFMIKEGWNEGTPGKMWDSALVLSDMFSSKLSREPGCLRQRHIIDLSAGTGCCGLLIASMCQTLSPDSQPRITLTDLPQALDLIRHNKDINIRKALPNVSVERLRWGNDSDAKRVLSKAEADIVIASDVLYEPACFGRLVKTLTYLTTPGKTVIYLGYKRRGLNDEEEAKFFDLCSVEFHIHLIQEGQGGSDAVDWEKDYGYMTKSHHGVDGEGWLGSYVQNIKENTSLGGFKDMGVRIYRLVRRVARN